MRLDGVQAEMTYSRAGERAIIIDQTSQRPVRRAGLGPPRGLGCPCGLRLDGPSAPMLIDGATDGAALAAWIERQLVPTLSPGDVVVLDARASASRWRT